MSTTYDWSPVFQAAQGLGQRFQYQKALEAMLGGQAQTGVPQQPQQNPSALPTPPMTVNPGSVGGMQLPTQNIPSQPAPAPPPQMATPQAASNPYASMLPMLKFMDPSMGMPLLMQMQMKQAEHQQNIQDRAVKPLSDEEAMSLHLRPGGVYGKDISGNITTIQPSDMKSEGAIKQVQDEKAFENHLPMNAYQSATIKDVQTKNAETSRHDRATEAEADAPPDADTVKYWAQSVAAGGPMPTLGMGKQAASYRQAILKEAAGINSGKGMTGIDQNVANATTKANTATLTKQTQLRSATEGFENTMLQNMNVVRSLLSKGAGNTGVPIANRFERYLRGEYGGDPDVVALNNALDTVADENAKIRSGTLGNTPATDAMRGNIRSGLNGSMTTGQIEKAFSVMEQDAGNRSRSLRAQEDALKHGLQGKSDTPNIPGIHEPQSDPVARKTIKFGDLP